MYGKIHIIGVCTEEKNPINTSQGQRATHISRP